VGLASGDGEPPPGRSAASRTNGALNTNSGSGCEAAITHQEPSGRRRTDNGSPGFEGEMVKL
jgi:hypothetical protein